LTGTIRHEFLDHTLFWNEQDLARKLAAFTDYYNWHRTHAGLIGQTPEDVAGTPAPLGVDLRHYAWKPFCGGLFQLPIAA
jgi:putative transposase